GFYLENSLTFTELENQLQNGTFAPIAPDTALEKLLSVNLLGTFAKKWCQGQQVPVNQEVSGLVRVYEQETRFLGIGQIQSEHILIPKMVFEPIS
ncbi:MAG: tRNA pseudouridine(55) synthase TruB, partial [Nostocales cyanobacterium]